MKCVCYLVLFAVLASCCKATGFFDLLKWGLDIGAPSFGREAEVDDASLEEDEQKCTCVDGLHCSCCMTLNFTLFDFGEPGCVNIEYAAFDRTLEFNMTFGDNEIHSQSVDVENIEPACMNLVGDVPIAYVCATLSRFKLETDHMKGCVHLEPTILGETQARYFVGCFGFGNETRTSNETVSAEKISNRKGNRTSSVESSSASGSGQSASEEEEEEDEDSTAPSGIIEQGASILSNLIYYFSPDSPEEVEKEKDKQPPKKIVLISSTEAAATEDKTEVLVGASELPPVGVSEEYSGEEEYEESGGEEAEEESGGSSASTRR